MKHLLLTCAMVLLALAGHATCTAQFTWSQTPNNTSLLRITVNNTSTYSGAPVNSWPQYTYKYGDGTPVTYINNHSYANPGTYTVTLYMNVYDSVNQTLFCSDSVQHSVTVNYPPCGATISYSASQTTAGQFTFTASNPANTPGITYNWNFGDGTTGTGSPVTHTYLSAGSKAVTLYTSAAGCSDSIVIYINVSLVAVTCGSLHAQFTSSTSNLTAYFFNSSTNITGYNRTFFWDFGDGTTSTQASPSHGYTSPGTYTVKLKTTWTNNSVTPAFQCQDSVTHTITILPLSCANLHAVMIANTNGNIVLYCYNNSTYAPGYVKQSFWTFGDGNSSTLDAPTYTYAAPGTYTVKLVNKWVDSAATTVFCIDSVTQTITVTPAPNVINGIVVTDSNAAPSNIPDTFKVWLIQFNSSTNMLSAVDSTVVSGYHYATFWFSNQSAGNYLLKAKLISGPTSGYGYVPTYFDSSLYWNTATSFAHAGSITGTKIIRLKQGIITSGPGFVGGNVSLGANKGTTGGIPGMAVLLLDQNNQLTASAITDANGDFSISNIPLGTYSLYPEQMNYTTIPYTVTIGAGQTSLSGINFHQDDAQMNIMAHPTAIRNTLSGSQEVRLYPNPAHQSVTLTWNGFTMRNGRVTVTNITGQQVQSAALADNSRSKALDLSALQPGIYFVHLSSGEAETTLKLVVRQ